MKKTIGIVAAVLLAAVMLAACGPSNADVQALLDEAVASAQAELLPEASEAAAEETGDAPTATPEPTEEATPVAMPTANPDLADEWNSFQFQLDGVVYALPVRYSELVADGWKPSGSIDDTLKPDQYIVNYTTLKKGGNEIGVQFANLDSETLPLADCYVSGIMFFDLSEGIPPVFPGGVTMGSSMDDVKSLYGEPSDTTEYSTTTEWEYDEEIYADIAFTFDNETGKVTKLRMSNMYLPE